MAPSPAQAATTKAKKPELRFVDTHAHIFEQGLPLASKRRYAPEYDAKVESFLKLLDANNMAVGVLVQPSFLGTDNSYMLKALRRHPDRLRGVAVVDPAISHDELMALHKDGVVGIRLNLIGTDLPDLTGGPWPALLAWVKKMDWHVELHREAKDLPQLMEPLLKAKVRIVVDHFGRPDPKDPLGDPGFKYLLSKGGTGLVWVKLSGAYRNGSLESGDAFAAAATKLLLKSYGPKRLLWGSDWPHTGFEKQISYEVPLRAFERWVPDAATRGVILGKAPWELFPKQTRPEADRKKGS